MARRRDVEIRGGRKLRRPKVAFVPSSAQDPIALGDTPGFLSNERHDLLFAETAQIQGRELLAEPRSVGVSIGESGDSHSGELDDFRPG